MVDLTAKQAAAQIVTLINSRPATPWPNEIEAIIAHVAPIPDATLTLPDHVVAYRDRAGKFMRQSKVVGPMRPTEPNYAAEYRLSTDLSNQVDEIGDVILDTPAETWGDLVGLASIILHEAGHDLDAIGDLSRSRERDPEPVAAEMLALAILRLQAMAIPQQHVCAHVDPLGPVSRELAAAFFDWDQARIRESEELDDQAARARQDIIAEKTAALFAIGVRSFADLRLIVPAVVYWNSPASVKSPDYPECVLEPGGEDEGEGFEPKSLAYLVRAVIGLLGMGGVASSIPVHARQDDPTLAALQERLREVDRLHDEAKRLYDVAGRNRGADPALAAANDKADEADFALTELSKRIFAVRPITAHNLKLRATIAKYWQELGDQGEKWTLPEQCTDWESEVFAHLIDGVLRFDTPPDGPSLEPVALPSPELATFRSALQGLRTYPEPDVDSPEYETWYAQQSRTAGRPR